MATHDAPFARSMRTLADALSLGDDLVDMEFGEAMVHLHTRCDRSNFAIRLSSYATGRIAGTRLLLEDSTALDHEDFARTLEDYLFHLFLIAVSFRYSENVPKYHHWLPVSYANRFAHWRGKSGRSFRVTSTRFELETGEAITKDCSSGYFAHGRRKSTGFYHLAVEYFFSLVEHDASIGYRQVQNNMDHRARPLLVSFGFFIVQAVRNPHPNTQLFPIGTLRGVADALALQMGEVTPTLTLQAVRSSAPLAFTPYVPTRVRRLADRTRVLYFPLGPGWALLASDRLLSHSEASSTVARSQEIMVSVARKTGVEIFGLDPAEIE